MYQIIPKRANKNGNVLMWILYAVGAIIFAIGFSNIISFSGIFQMLSLMVITAAVLVGTRFVFADYEYTVSGDNFTVGERKGNKFRITARILISDIEKIITVTDGKPLPKSDLQRKVFDYRPSLLPKEYVALIITDHNYCEDGEEMCILLEPDKKMLLFLSDGN